jgi:hypothetical protein
MASKPSKRPATTAKDRRSLEDLGNTASQVIQEAAAVLEEELAAGLIAAQKVSKRLKEEQRFEKEDFADALKRFQSTGQELIEIARARMSDLHSDATQELSQRFLNDAQGALDVVVDLIAVGPDLANRFLKPGKADQSAGHSGSSPDKPSKAHR